jgi:hypothetical protein
MVTLTTASVCFYHPSSEELNVITVQDATIRIRPVLSQLTVERQIQAGTALPTMRMPLTGGPFFGERMKTKDDERALSCARLGLLHVTR